MTTACCSTCRAAAIEFPAGAVKRISAGNVLAWNVRTPTGSPDRIATAWACGWRGRRPRAVVTKRIGEAHIIEGREFVAERDGAEFRQSRPLPTIGRSPRLHRFRRT